MNTSIRRRLLATLGAASLALIASAPADAAYRSYEPADGDAPVAERTAERDDTTQAGCSVTLSTGQTIVYPHGHSFSIVNKSTGKTHTFTCNNGKWEETVSASSHHTEYTYDEQDATFEAQP